MPILGSLGCEYFALQYFMPTHDAYSWLSRKWVTTLPCNISCLLMMLVLGSPAGEWLLCLAIFHACSWCLFLVSREWVATLPCNISCLFMMSILGSPESEWLLCPAIFHACSWCLFLTLQNVSGYFALQYFMPAHDACSWLSSWWVATLPFSCLLMMLVLNSQNVSGYFALQDFMPAHDACTWLSRMWVATLPCIISCLLMMLVLGSPGSECLAIFHAWLWCLYLALQVVSGYFASPCFMPAHDTCSWLSRMSVIAVPCHVLCLLMMFLTFQEVSDCCTLPYFMPAHHACSWLSRLWVAICLPIVYTCLWCLFLALQFVSGYCALPYSCLVMMPVLGSPACECYFTLPYFMPSPDVCSWLTRKWVATVPCHISCLLMMPVFGPLGSECLTIFHASLWCLYLALQIVSGYCLTIFYASSCQFLALQTVSSCSLTIFYTSSCQFLSLQTVRGYGAFSYFMLMMPILDCSESEWLQCFPIIHA